MDPIVIFVTASSEEEAQKIANGLLQKKLIACANIMSGVKSMFWWQGKIDHANEYLLILKTQRKLFPKVAKTVKSLHSYDVPEIIALPIIEGEEGYLKWLANETSG